MCVRIFGTARETWDDDVRRFEEWVDNRTGTSATRETRIARFRFPRFFFFLFFPPAAVTVVCAGTSRRGRLRAAASPAAAAAAAAVTFASRRPLDAAADTPTVGPRPPPHTRAHTAPGRKRRYGARARDTRRRRPQCRSGALTGRSVVSHTRTRAPLRRDVARPRVDGDNIIVVRRTARARERPNSPTRHPRARRPGNSHSHRRRRTGRDTLLPIVRRTRAPDRFVT